MKDFWKQIIVGAVLLALPVIAGYLSRTVLAFYGRIFEFCVRVFQRLTGKVELYLWVVIVLVFIATLALFFIAFSIFLYFKKPKWILYTKDHIDGVEWMWNYDTHNKIDNLSSICPFDKTRLVYKYKYYADNSEFSWQCETCQKEFGPFQGPVEYDMQRVLRRIEKNIRTGSFDKSQ